MQLHDYEVAELIDDLKIGYGWAERTAKKLYAKVLEVAPCLPSLYGCAYAPSSLSF